MRETLVDALLVEKAQAGERYAFDCLVVKYQRRLVQMVATMTFNMDDAEDVVQDSFIKAFRALSSFRGEASFYTWIFRITLNTAKNFLTTKRSRAIISMELTTNEDGTPVDHALADESQSPSASLQNRQPVAVLNETLQRMPTPLSTALVLCEIEGLSYQEIADMMGTPIGTVRSRIFRARELIAARLEATTDCPPFRTT
ncbi:sigma-70 family RNA polymerase sigma factor [Massilia sp. CF038]|uniref:sigma-70 family RNA polymerase sigma factor n=1 Tax=Massilia sp. CF038 TaxID=1881045 RepID=UPI0009241E5B|nr:sigma-70 family RNA polymerase sigma factor [Massilia sp. CF038]SHH20391.1 RNA polymerase, sigma-24 subunit, RpoE [Massilia sp. CF038]